MRRYKQEANRLFIKYFRKVGYVVATELAQEKFPSVFVLSVCVPYFRI
jgi:hypothetical protein